MQRKRVVLISILFIILAIPLLSETERHVSLFISHLTNPERYSDEGK